MEIDGGHPGKHGATEFRLLVGEVDRRPREEQLCDPHDVHGDEHEVPEERRPDEVMRRRHEADPHEARGDREQPQPDDVFHPERHEGQKARQVHEHVECRWKRGIHRPRIGPPLARVDGS
jgi:hypothetical protein